MKKIFFIFAFCLFSSVLSAKVINDGQIIPPESQIYNDFLLLQSNSNLLSFTNNTPLSVSELKFYLKQYDYDSLDDYGQFLYDKIYDELYEKEDLLKNIPDFHITIHPKINLEFYYKTNEDILESEQFQKAVFFSCNQDLKEAAITVFPSGFFIVSLKFLKKSSKRFSAATLPSV